MSVMLEKLKAFSLGTHLTQEEAKELIQSSQERHIPRGTTLFCAGDSGDALYVIVEGALEVILGPRRGGTVVATLGAGQIVGEVEAMNRSARVASLVATIDTLVLELSGEKFREIISENRPIATKMVTYIARTLARRLASINQRIIAKQTPQKTTESSLQKLAEDLVIVDAEDLDVLDKLWS
ncbi:MAG: cyclic nucleotide-binding domain-containing protein [Myxococcota bacterium]